MTEHNTPESGEPINPNVMIGLTLLCTMSGIVFVSAFILPSLVGRVLSPEMVLGAGMTFAASFLITISLLPEDYGQTEAEEADSSSLLP